MTETHPPVEPVETSVSTSPTNTPQSNPTSRVLLAIGSVLGIVAVAWLAVFFIDLALSRTTTTHESYDAVRTVELVADGDVTVSAAEGGVEVDAVAHRGITAPRYSVDEGADRLVVTHRCVGWRWAVSRCAGELSVTLPADTEVVVRTSNGAVVASGLAGTVEVQTSNGRVEATQLGGALMADTSNGAIEVRGAAEDVDVETSNGAIEVSGVGGTLTADSSNGRIEVEDVTGSATATTSNGRIDVAGVGGDVYAETSNGEVVVHGGDEPVRLTIETSNGDQTIEGSTDPDAQRTVEIHSSNGNVAYLGE
jgi:hypothetical protein